jgi:hypothetical protein
MFIAKSKRELKTIAAGNQTFKRSESPFALNPSPRAGNLRRDE